MAQPSSPLQVAFQMDPFSTVDVNADSSFRLMEEAQNRGHSLFHYTPDDLVFMDGAVQASMRPVCVQRDPQNPGVFGAAEMRDLTALDVVWLRQDPPFDMGYITTTHLLDLLAPHTMVVNAPFWVRNAPEKLLVLQFPDLTPPTAIARDLSALKAFRATHGDVIVKPLYGNGGAGVFRLPPEDKN
ncbi:MAG: glutathione synthase, partial [Pseudomonadota bacterium]